jgi:hypothetical protein
VPDLFGALSLVIGVAALVWAIVEIPSTDSSALKIGAASALALVALALAIWRSGRHHTPRHRPGRRARRTHVPAASPCAAVRRGLRRHAARQRHAAHTVWHEAPAPAGLSLSAAPIVVVVVSLTVASRLINKLAPERSAAALIALAVALDLKPSEIHG